MPDYEVFAQPYSGFGCILNRIRGAVNGFEKGTDKV